MLANNSIHLQLYFHVDFINCIIIPSCVFEKWVVLYIFKYDLIEYILEISNGLKSGWGYSHSHKGVELMKWRA